MAFPYLIIIGMVGGWPAFWVALLTLVLFA